MQNDPIPIPGSQVISIALFAAAFVTLLSLAVGPIPASGCALVLGMALALIADDD